MLTLNLATTWAFVGLVVGVAGIAFCLAAQCLWQAEPERLVRKSFIDRDIRERALWAMSLDPWGYAQVVALYDGYWTVCPANDRPYRGSELTVGDMIEAILWAEFPEEPHHSTMDASLRMKKAA